MPVLKAKNNKFLGNNKKILSVNSGPAKIKLTPIAVYSSDDNSLTFYNVVTIPKVGEIFNGKTITNVYSGFEDTPYNNDSNAPNIQWYSISENVLSVSFDATFASVKPTYTEAWFWRFTNCTEINLENLDTSNVKSMRFMFQKCNSLTELDVSGFDTKNVTDMGYMFDACNSLTELDVSGFDTKNVTDMGCMFYACNSLTELDVSGFDTKNVTDMQYMFFHCENMPYLNLSAWDTSKVTAMGQMFGYCYKLTSLDLSNFSTTNVTAMNGMFREAGLEELNLSGFDTSKVTEINAMFRDATSIKTIYVDSDWNLSSVTNDSNMFLNCTSIVGGIGTKYDSSKINSSMAHIDTTNNPGYFTSK